MNAMPILAQIRPEVLAIETQQIMQVSTLAMDDPEVIAMWYGESDITTPEFICDAAASALRRGRTKKATSPQRLLVYEQQLCGYCVSNCRTCYGLTH